MTIAIQRVVFVAVAGIAILAGSVWTLPPVSTQIALSAALILLLGVPHGALDMLYARPKLKLVSLSRLALFGIGYLGAAALVVILWVASPLAFLILFLLGSAFHFSGDVEEGAPLSALIVHGFGVIALPQLLYKRELTELFGMLATAEAAGWVVLGLGAVAIVVVLSAVHAVFFFLSKKRSSEALEIFTIVVLAVVCPPLIAFTVYFCLGHSARHILRSANIHSQTLARTLQEMLLPMVGVAVLVGVSWALRNTVSVDARIIQIIFVGLAALTAPHMLLVEPVRLRGWALAKSES